MSVVVRKRGSFKFTDKRTSVGGVVSSIYFLMSLGLIIWASYISYKSEGNSGIAVGALGMTAFLVATGGFALGIRSFKEDDVFLKYPWIGTVGNAIVWLFMIGVILVGI